MWKLSKEEYSELCSVIGEKLKITSNWVWDKENKNNLGKFHQFHGLNFNSSTFNILRFYYEIKKVELYQERKILNEKNLEDSESEFIEKETLIFCLKKYSQSKLKEFKGLFDIGLYEQEDLDNLELRMNSLFDKV